ncbi:hypothetical protein DEJ49_27130 [Streptomyces venezuelae]|uniref:Type VII secretion system protein EccE domain-containing protein n=1 Tax=Streptomyces venezuelae TaxID=54571 RepID=A0A5P2CPD9_STRVZ|nr:hypothetical protein DEJ49_27130 [Streptomyces venezuelae]
MVGDGTFVTAVPQALTGAPTVRITWIALTLDPQLSPEAVPARGGGLTGPRGAWCAPRTSSRVDSQESLHGCRDRIVGYRSTDGLIRRGLW